jgi:hypothetical protein
MADTPEQPKEQSKSALKKAEKQAKMAAEKAAKAAKQATVVVGQGKRADDITGITVKKEEDFSMWYQEVVLKAEMIEYYNEVSPRCSVPRMPTRLLQLTWPHRSLVSLSCAQPACISGTSFASGSRSGSRIWAWRRPVSLCSSPRNHSRRRRVRLIPQFASRQLLSRTAY